ncbi:MAG TPA: ZIP family zinc transporter [Propionibacteriaceae bacterium]|nr:ZIP family zinc transporter [Propionibacteriaceae bacterium]
MRTALLYGALASSSFVVGVVLGLFTKPSRRLVAGVVAFGAGVLVSALTFDLMREAFDKGGAVYAIGGFLLGAVIYVAADVGLERMAAKSPKRTGRDATDVVPGAAEKTESPKVAAVAGTALLVGALIDGIPESIAIGVSLHAEGPSLGLVLLAAVFLSNVPESLGSAAAMREEGRSRGYIIGVWAAVAVVCIVATVGGYALLAGLSPGLTSAILALAAGGILAMLADTMFPEALEHGGPRVALATAIGFACAMLLSEFTGA